MWSVKSLQLLCFLPFGILCVFCHQDDVCENYIDMVYVVGYCGLSERGLCVFGEFCEIGLLLVFKRSSILL